MFNGSDDTSAEVVPESHSVYFGPTFVRGVPIKEEWLSFINRSKEPKTLALMSLWLEKEKAENGIPLRKNFSFTELAKYGRSIAICRLTDDDRWLTTFCGNDIVSLVGYELTGQHLDEIGDDKTLKFWLDNLKIMTEKNKPFFEFYDLDFADKSYTHCEVLNLPLKSGNHDFADMFFSYTTVIKKSA